MKKLDIFISKYETIRQVISSLFIYGCYDGVSIAKRTKMAKSNFDRAWKKIKLFWPGIREQRVELRKVASFPFDRYEKTENYLWRSYQIKSFLPQDINAYFIVLAYLQAMHEAGEDEGLDVSQMTTHIQIDLLDDELGEDSKQKDKRMYRMISDKLQDMARYGLLEKTAERPVKYRLANNILEELGMTGVDELLLVLPLIRANQPLATLAYSTEALVHAYSETVLGEDASPAPPIILRNVPQQQLLQDELVLTALTALEQQHKLLVYKWSHRANAKQRERKLVACLTPLKLIDDFSYGRQYLFGMDQVGSPYFCRLDRLADLELAADSFEAGAGQELLSLLDYTWGASLPNDYADRQPVLVEVEFLDTSEGKIWARLHQEHRQGHLQRLTENIILFTIKLYSPTELIPWLRSFGRAATVRSSLEHDLSERLQRSWMDTSQIYKYGFQTLQLEDQQSAYDEESSKAGPALAECGPQIFSEYRNFFYLRLQSIYNSIWTAGESFTPAKIEKHLLQGVDGKLRLPTEFAQQGHNIREFLLFREQDDGTLTPGIYPNEEEAPYSPPTSLPLLLTSLEKRYLKTWLRQGGLAFMPKSGTTLLRLLKDIPPFSFDQHILRRGPTRRQDRKNTKTILFLLNMIKQCQPISCQNHTPNGTKTGVCLPYKLMHYADGRYKLVGITPCAKTDQHPLGWRPILMLLNRLSHLRKAELSETADPQAILAQHQVADAIELRLQPRHNNDLERCFLLFCTYDKSGWQENDGSYRLNIRYYDFQEDKQDILRKILSLGPAVEVLAPLDLRKQVQHEAETAVLNAMA